MGQVNSAVAAAAAAAGLPWQLGEEEKEEEEGCGLIDSPVLAHLASIHVLLQRERKIKEPHAGRTGPQIRYPAAARSIACWKAGN